MNRIGLEMIEAESMDQVKNQCVYPMVSEEYREAFKALTQNVFKGISGTLEFKMIGLKGRPLWLFTKAVPLRNEKGEIILSLATTIDITERKLAEKKLLASEERFRLAMLGASDGLWDWDLQTDQVYYSPRWKSMLGYAEEELESHLDTWKRVVHPDDLEPSLLFINNFLEGRAYKYELEFRLRHKDGHYLNILSRATLVRGADGKALRLVGTHVDMTDRRRAEEALLRSSAELEKSNKELQDALAKVKTLSSMLPICASCKKIRDDKGYWKQIESYITEHTDTLFSHGMCPDCTKKAYEELEKLKNKKT